MICKHCEHSIWDHGDRAVAPCAPDLPTNISAYSGRLVPRAKKCFCPGWEPAC